MLKVVRQNFLVNWINFFRLLTSLLMAVAVFLKNNFNYYIIFRLIIRDIFMKELFRTLLHILANCLDCRITYNDNFVDINLKT